MKPGPVTEPARDDSSYSAADASGGDDVSSVSLVNTMGMGNSRQVLEGDEEGQGGG